MVEFMAAVADILIPEEAPERNSVPAFGCM
jgi:hypothetical protein